MASFMSQNTGNADSTSSRFECFSLAHKDATFEVHKMPILGYRNVPVSSVDLAMAESGGHCSIKS